MAQLIPEVGRIHSPILASAINSSGVGITANVESDSTGTWLSLTSGTSGGAGNITVSNNSDRGYRANPWLLRHGRRGLVGFKQCDNVYRHIGRRCECRRPERHALHSGGQRNADIFHNGPGRGTHGRRNDRRHRELFANQLFRFGRCHDRDQQRRHRGPLADFPDGGERRDAGGEF
jgi:hypothetical protein